MIYMFRKEMKKWHTVLWLVFASLALGSGIGFFYKRKGPGEAVIGSVDGQEVTFNAYQKTLKNIVAPYVQLYGMSEDKVMSLLGQMGNLDEMAFNVCVEEKLVDRVQKSFNVKIDDETFNNRLAEMMPPAMIGEDGKVNMDMYQQYMKMLSTTPSEYEKNKEGEFKRDLVMRLIGNSSYISERSINAEVKRQASKKNFEILALTPKYFLGEAKKEAVDEKSLEAFFAQNKESYRVSDKAKVKYWEIDVDEYEQKMEVDEASIKAFYDKNKAQLYRIPPKVKVRKILIKSTSGKDGFKLAQELHQKVKQNPDQFATLAKQHSDDQQSSVNGGLIGFFSRGKYDADFEKAAFKLKEPGEITDIITTKDGYEIIQLVERIKAEEKSLESVKNEVISTLKNKRAIVALQGELGTLMHDARSDADSIEKYAKEKGLTEKETGWLSDTEAANADIAGQIAQKVLSGSGRESNYGNFKTAGKYVLYKLLQKEKSFLPELSQVKNNVIEDYYKNQADLMVKRNAAKIKSDVLSGTITLRAAAGKIGILQTATTGLIKRGDKVAELDENLAKKMFVLDDKSQVLQLSNNGSYYLIQLIDEQAPSTDKFAEEWLQILNKEKYMSTKRQITAFIASLQRNAKIEMDKKMLGLHKNKYSKED